MMSSNVPLSPPSEGGGDSADPVAVLLLNLFLFGAIGYLKIGQREKAIVAGVIWFALAYPTCFAASLAFAAVAAVDGYLQATELREGRSIGKWTTFSNHA
jgi:hypothetical protein